MKDLDRATIVAIGREPGERVARARRLSLVPYLAGSGTMILAGLLNPLGMRIVLISAAAASLGGTSLLAWYPAAPRAPSGLVIDPPLGVEWGVPWIVGAAIAMAIFIFLLGRESAAADRPKSQRTRGPAHPVRRGGTGAGRDYEDFR